MTENPYIIVKTQDGSLSLQYKQSCDLTEHMHHSGGALTESLYIYYAALEHLQQERWPHNILSIGLGTGLNEMISVAHKIKFNIEPVYIESFESEEFLSHSFQQWTLGQSSALDELYKHNLSRVAEHFSIQANHIKEQLKSVLLKPALTEDSKFTVRFNAVFFDFFSTKMNETFWSEEFISRLIDKALQPKAVFTTYASTGALKRALRSQGFIIEKKSGFKGKRESTFALRS